MTAIKDVTLESGILVENAIHRIESATVGYKNEAKYTVRVYKDLSLPAFYEFTGECQYHGGDVVAECYSDLMLNGDYTEA